MSGCSRKMQVLVAFMLALSAALLLLPACGQATSDPRLANGWSWYHDARFTFRVPVPPGWRTGSFTDGPLTNEECAYVVDFFPPGSKGQPSKGAQENEPELISITVNVSCAEWQPSDDPYFKPDPHPVIVSGVQATLYNGDVPDSALQRTVVARFGGHQYLFSFHYNYGAATPAAKGQHELSLYEQMLAGFAYRAK